LRSAEPELTSRLQGDTGVSAENAITTQELIGDLAARHREFADRLARRQSQLIPAEDPDYEPLGLAFPAWTDPGRAAILQPPPPQIPPAQRTLEHIADHDLDMEAGY
jgi:hypothetical protein